MEYRPQVALSLPALYEPYSRLSGSPSTTVLLAESRFRYLQTSQSLLLSVFYAAVSTSFPPPLPASVVPIVLVLIRLSLLRIDVIEAFGTVSGLDSDSS